jgi:hypothetical protein
VTRAASHQARKAARSEMDTGNTLFFDRADPEWVTRLSRIRVD